MLLVVARPASHLVPDLAQRLSLGRLHIRPRRRVPCAGGRLDEHRLPRLAPDLHVKADVLPRAVVEHHEAIVADLPVAARFTPVAGPRHDGRHTVDRRRAGLRGRQFLPGRGHQFVLHLSVGLRRAEPTGQRLRLVPSCASCHSHLAVLRLVRTPRIVIMREACDRPGHMARAALVACHGPGRSPRRGPTPTCPARSTWYGEKWTRGQSLLARWSTRSHHRAQMTALMRQAGRRPGRLGRSRENGPPAACPHRSRRLKATAAESRAAWEKCAILTFRSALSPADDGTPCGLPLPSTSKLPGCWTRLLSVTADSIATSTGM